MPRGGVTVCEQIGDTRKVEITVRDWMCDEIARLLYGADQE
jgi:hypothetical protein